MQLRELLAWQMQGYDHYHATRANLALHLVVVPVFWAGFLAVVLGLVAWQVGWVAGGVGLMAASMALQGRGHAREPVPAVPFSGWQNALVRILLEQWVTFPWFVATGGWLRAWRRAG